jgi:hypothetical protein
MLSWSRITQLLPIQGLDERILWLDVVTDGPFMHAEKHEQQNFPVCDEVLQRGYCIRCQNLDLNHVSRDYPRDFVV